MSDLKTLRNRIKGIKNIQKITQAMKVVAASKLRKARQAAEETRLFSDSTKNAFIHTLQSINSSDEIGLDFLDKETPESSLIVIVSSDRGLCGGLNTNLVKHTASVIEEIRSKGQDCKLLLIGKKAGDSLSNRYQDLVFDKIDGFSSRKISLEEVIRIKNIIMDSVKQKQFDNVRIIYSGFESAISQIVVDKLFIGSRKDLLSQIEDSSSSDSNDHIEFEYEPNKKEVILGLFEYYIISTLNQAFFESFASEQGARMTAMDNAVNNCNELVRKLTLVYNRTRQAKITTELVEIISAVESL